MKKIAAFLMGVVLVLSMSGMTVSASKAHVAHTNPTTSGWTVSDYNVLKQVKKYNLFGPDYEAGPGW